MKAKLSDSHVCNGFSILSCDNLFHWLYMKNTCLPAASNDCTANAFDCRFNVTGALTKYCDRCLIPFRHCNAIWNGIVGIESVKE